MKSARLLKTLRKCRHAIRLRHLSEDERDQIGVLRRLRDSRWGPLPGRSTVKIISRESEWTTLCPRAGSPRSTPPEPNVFGRWREAILAATMSVPGRRVGQELDAEQIVVEIRDELLAAGDRSRENLRLHRSDRAEGRGLVALYRYVATNSPASRQSLARPPRIERRSMMSQDH